MKKFLRRAFGLATIIGAIIYLLSCLTPYIDPTRFSPLTFLALGFPIGAVCFLLLAITWLFLNKRISLILFIVLLVGFPNIRSAFGFHFASSFKVAKDSTQLRVVTWNVRNFDNCARHAESPTAIRRQMINYLKQLNADVVMFQEFMEYKHEGMYSNIQTMDSLGFHYSYTTRDLITYPSYGPTYFGCAIFSKYPIIDSGKVAYDGLPFTESFAYSDIVFNDKRVRLFTTHLASMNLRKTSESREDPFYLKYDSAFSFKNPIYKKLIFYDRLHAKQAAQLNAATSKSPYPVILTGDFNSVSSSYVYHTIKGNKKDVFAEKGSGLGTTYSTISRTLRIDYLLVDPTFKVTQWSTPALYLSDHFPVVADLHFN